MNKQQQNEAVERFEATKYERCVEYMDQFGVTPDNIDEKLEEMQGNPNNGPARQKYIDFIMAL